jgi:hypothetical protein
MDGKVQNLFCEKLLGALGGWVKQHGAAGAVGVFGRLQGAWGGCRGPQYAITGDEGLWGTAGAPRGCRRPRLAKRGHRGLLEATRATRGPRAAAEDTEGWGEAWGTGQGHGGLWVIFPTQVFFMVKSKNEWSFDKPDRPKNCWTLIKLVWEDWDCCPKKLS